MAGASPVGFYPHPFYPPRDHTVLMEVWPGPNVALTFDHNVFNYGIDRFLVRPVSSCTNLNPQLEAYRNFLDHISTHLFLLNCSIITLLTPCHPYEFTVGSIPSRSRE